MPRTKVKKSFTFYKPGNYRIRIQGFLDKSWSERISGMRITIHNEDDGAPVTSLEGRVRDQAELAGVLNTLYELHLPLLSVKSLDDE